MFYRPAVLNSSLASPSRRTLFRLAFTAVAFAGAVGCNKKPEPTPEAASSPGAPAAAAAPADGKLTVGFIYVGAKDDYGYNQAHAEAAKIVATLPNIKIREEENVPETVAVQKTMESMINLDGAKLLFPTSFGYFDPHILKLAEKYPDVTFFHCGGLCV
jgi:basic membrane lipoprotein Med (substrate-binding protein (PBP1-ABC) superfamily)